MHRARSLRPLALGSLLALVVAGVPFIVNDLHSQFLLPDFSAYYLAGAALNEGASPYDPAAPPRIAARTNLTADVPYSRFIYPPAFAALMRPVAVLPYRFAALSWLGLSSLALVLALRQVMRLYRWPRRAAARWALVAACALTPASIETLFEGQVNTLVLFLSVAALCVAVRKPASRAPGAYLATAAVLKVYPAAFLLALWRGRFRRAVAGLVGGCIAWLIVGLWWGGGISALREWPRSVSRQAGSIGANAPNQSIYGVMLRLGSGGTYPSRAVPRLAVGSRTLSPALSRRTALFVALALSLIVAALTAAVVLLVPASGSARVDVGLRLSVLIAAALIVTPVAWDHYDVLLLVSPFVVLLAARRSPAAWWAFLAGANLIVLHRYWRVLIPVMGHAALSLALAGRVLCWAAAAALLLQRATLDRSRASLYSRGSAPLR